MKELNVLYSTDNNYAAHAAASIRSLVDNNGDFEQINIHVLNDNLSEEVKRKLHETVKMHENAKIFFHPLASLLSKLNLNDKSGFAKAGYGRLMISEIIDADKLLYIDCDTIINGSVEKLWDTDIAEYYVAGVQDNPALFSLTAVGMNMQDRYINSGVLLINLKKWREDKLEKRFIEMVKAHGGYVKHHDQGIINGVCKGNILVLHPRYNTMSQFFLMNAKQIKKLYDIETYYSQEELDDAVRKPIIVHYITKFYNRPWYKDCTHPLKNLYIKYLSETPFEVKLLDGKLNRKIRLRKFVFEKMPFGIFYAIERILNIKRKRVLNKKF